MIKAEIKKNNTVYVLDLTHLGDIQKAYTNALEIATSKEVSYINETQVLDLGTSQEYDHIRVYVEEDQQVEIEETAAPKSLEDMTANYVKPFTDTIAYLGRYTAIAGIKAQADKVGFVLIYEVDGLPAHVALSKEGLKRLTYYQGQILGWNDPTAIVAPADLQGEEDAIEYMKDYLKELEDAARKYRDSKTKTATAFTDFNKDE